MSVPQSENGDGTQEGECTTAQQDSHEHTNATNASMPEQPKNLLEIFRENFQLCNAGLWRIANFGLCVLMSLSHST